MTIYIFAFSWVNQLTLPSLHEKHTHTQTWTPFLSIQTFSMIFIIFTIFFLFPFFSCYFCNVHHFRILCRAKRIVNCRFYEDSRKNVSFNQVGCNELQWLCISVAKTRHTIPSHFPESISECQSGSHCCSNHKNICTHFSLLFILSMLKPTRNRAHKTYRASKAPTNECQKYVCRSALMCWYSSSSTALLVIDFLAALAFQPGFPGCKFDEFKMMAMVAATTTVMKWILNQSNCIKLVHHPPNHPPIHPPPLTSAALSRSPALWIRSS